MKNSLANIIENCANGMLIGMRSFTAQADHQFLCGLCPASSKLERDQFELATRLLLLYYFCSTLSIAISLLGNSLNTSKGQTKRSSMEMHCSEVVPQHITTRTPLASQAGGGGTTLVPVCLCLFYNVSQLVG